MSGFLFETKSEAFFCGLYGLMRGEPLRLRFCGKMYAHSQAESGNVFAKETLGSFCREKQNAKGL
jgi:hypothetical protein